MKSKRSIIHVVYRRSLSVWLVLYVRLFDDEGDRMELKPERCVSKEKAEKIGRKDAKDFQPSSLRIHRKDGTIQEERTYPRSSDPKRSKG